MGKNVIIKQGVFIKEPQNIEIGSNVSIQEYCLLSGYGGLKIGNHVSIAAGTYVFTSSHPYSDKSINFRDGTLEKRPVVIGSNVWIGAGCRILGELAIGDNVIIGAGSVVTKDLPSNGVYAGVPATQIKEL
jgi:acetyltransferase-like isoleucine patch superfamily enzyme